MSVTGLLSTLRDVEGVMGSFVVDLLGQVRARDMPAMFDDQSLDEAAPRIARLKDALETQGEQVDQVTISHGAHALFLRTTGDLILCVLTPGDVSLPALRMGTGLVLKRLPDLIASAGVGSTLPPTLRPPPSVAPAFSPTLPGPPPVPAVPLYAPARAEAPSRPAAAPPPLPVPQGPPPVPAGPPPVPVAAAAPVKRPRFFRGRLIEDD